MIKVPADPRSHLVFLENYVAELREQDKAPEQYGRTHAGIQMEIEEHTRMIAKLKKQLGIA